MRASPALPVGGFSYSEGLEAAVEGGQVPDEAGAARWLGDQLALSLQRALSHRRRQQSIPRLHQCKRRLPP